MEDTREISTTPVAGWYWHPDAVGGLRYWDGSEWSENRAPAPVPAPKVSGKAIAALVLGIVWVYGITSILAIIFAVRESNGWLTGGGMATAGLVLGIIGVVAIIVIVILAVVIGSLEGQP